MKDEHFKETLDGWEEWDEPFERRLDKIYRLKVMLDEESRLRYAMTKGREEGRREGRREGREQGRKEGREKGRQQVMTKVIRNGYENGVSLSTLSMLTGYSEKEVQCIIQSFQNEKESRVQN